MANIIGIDRRQARGMSTAIIALTLAAAMPTTASAQPTAFGTDSGVALTWWWRDGGGGHVLTQDCSFADVPPGKLWCGPGFRENSLGGTHGKADPSLGAISLQSDAASQEASQDGSAWVSSSWRDTVVFGGAGLPAGTRASVRFTVQLSADLKTLGGGFAEARASMGSGFSLTEVVLNTSGQVGGVATYDAIYDLNSPIPLNGWARTIAETRGDPHTDQAWASAKYFLDVLTPGVTVSTASGHNYASAVPELPAWAMLLAGMAAVSCLQRARRDRAARAPGP